MGERKLRKHKRKLSKFLAAFLSAALLTQPGVEALGAIPVSGMLENRNALRATDSNAVEVATASNAGIAPMSLLPLKSVQTYLDLYFYSDEELSAVPLQDIFNMWYGTNHDPIEEIPEEANIVWTRYLDEEGNVIEDEYHIQDREATVDLRPVAQRKSYDMDIIVGSGKQLDPGNILYHTDVNIRFVKGGKVYLNTGDYDGRDLSNVPVETMLSLLKDSKGNLIEIPENAKIVWNYEKDENGIVLSDEYHLKDRNGTVDLRPEFYGDNDYTFELFIEDGMRQQMGTQYDVQVSSSNIIDIDFTNPKLYLHTADGEDWEQISVSESGRMVFTKLDLLSDVNVPMTQLTCINPEHKEGNEYRFLFNVGQQGYMSGIRTDVYPMKNFLEYHCDGKELHGSITNQILSSTDFGYLNEFQDISGDPNADNVFCFVFSDRETGDIVGYYGVAVVVKAEHHTTEGKILSYESGEMKDVTQSYEAAEHYAYAELNVGSKGNGVSIWYPNAVENYYLKPGYQQKRQYYYVLNDSTGVEKVVLGVYDSLEEAEKDGAKDITEWVFPNSTTYAPYGYRIDFRNDHDVPISVLFEDGSAYKYYLTVNESLESGDGDPSFEVTGALEYRSLIIGKSMDTYYQMGYQTGLILDETVDLSSLRPIFNLGQNVHVHCGTEQVSGVSKQDFSKGPVIYKATNGDNEKQYFVTFKKKQGGPSLFVNGPDVREIFLTDLYDNRHDILIANIGSESLTGLKAELVNASHVKIDDYWNVGGEDNDMLAAFEYADTYYTPNLAKVRLVPDGEGDISGTLQISADGQEDVFIELQGFAGNPEITTESLADGVKFVPYSFMIDTSNIHSGWIKVTYSLEGTLPNGLTFNTSTGEIYGVPQEAGEFPITVTADFNRKEFVPSTAKFILMIDENTNEKVYQESDDGYIIETPIGIESIEGSYDFVATSTKDQLFVSSGNFNEFIDFWLNGEKLVDSVDYEKEAGSTRITIKSQTFQNKTWNGANTIAAEFRVDGDTSKELKRTAQNFRLELSEEDDDNEPGEPDNPNNPSIPEKPVNPEAPENPGSPDDTEDPESPVTPDDPGNTDSSGGRFDNDSDGDSDDSTVQVYRPNDTSTPSYTDASWLQDENGWKCQKPDGTLLTDTWQQIPYNGTLNWYFFDEQGYMMTGWLNRGGTWYYLNPASDGTRGRMMTGWQYIGDIWYYFGENDAEEGKMVSEGWHYLSYNGAVNWYHFNADGGMDTGWLEIGGQTYYLYPVADGTRGYMMTGWQQIGGNWYYFSEEEGAGFGAMKRSAWIGDDYVDSDGI